jgi:general secretion pathway protein E
VFELLQIDEQIRNLITGSTDSTSIDKVAMAAGMTTMFDDGVAKCRAGLTSAAEVLRVTTVR